MMLLRVAVVLLSAVSLSAALSVAAEARIRANLWNLYLQNESDTVNFIPAKVIRLAFHDALTYRIADGTGGPHAVMNNKCPGSSCENNYPDNAGLQFIIDLISPLYEPAELSVADFWALAAVVAVDFSATPPPQRNRVVTAANSLITFMAGRTDRSAAFSSPRNRFPDPESGYSAIKGVFAGMGFTAAEMVALLGAHSVGRLNAGNSGYTGPWVGNNRVLNNGYYNSLIGRKWALFKTPNPTSTTGAIISIWKPQNPNANNPDNTLPSMLNSDVCIAHLGAETNAARTEVDFANPSTFVRNAETFDLVQSFANNNQLFLTSFASAYKKLIELGYSNLVPIGTAVPSATAVPQAGTVINGTVFGSASNVSFASFAASFFFAIVYLFA